MYLFEKHYIYVYIYIQSHMLRQNAFRKVSSNSRKYRAKGSLSRLQIEISFLDTTVI